MVFSVASLNPRMRAVSTADANAKHARSLSAAEIEVTPGSVRDESKPRRNRHALSFDVNASSVLNHTNSYKRGHAGESSGFLAESDVLAFMVELIPKRV